VFLDLGIACKKRVLTNVVSLFPHRLGRSSSEWPLFFWATSHTE
jgi:hypothetical protein